MSRGQLRVGGAAVAGIMAATALGTIVLALYIAPLVLFGLAGIGFFPVETASLFPESQPGDLQITYLVPAADVHVGDVLMLWDSSSNTRYSHHVITAQQLFDGVRFVTAGIGGSSPDSATFIVEQTDALPVVLWTLPIWGDVVAVLYSPQFQAMSVFVLVVISFIVLMRRFPSQKPGLNNAGWNDD